MDTFKKISILSVFIFFFILIQTSLSAPAQWGIAINNDTKECAGYWPGDEFYYFALPDSWEDYYPGSDGSIETPYGKCDFTSEQECCEQLGLRYVSDQIGIDETYEEVVGEPVFLMFASLFLICCCVLILIILLIVMIIFLKKKNRSK